MSNAEDSEVASGTLVGHLMQAKLVLQTRFSGSSNDFKSLIYSSVLCGIEDSPMQDRKYWKKILVHAFVSTGNCQ